jgi:hypothetical protein
MAETGKDAIPHEPESAPEPPRGRAVRWRTKTDDPIAGRPLPGRTGRMAGLGGGALLVIGVISLAFATAGSSNQREMPTLSMAVAKGADPDSVNIRVTAVAPSVQSDGKLMLRVVALKIPEGTNPSRACQSIQSVGVEAAKKYAPVVFRVLHWGDSGPNAAGEATVSAQLGASTKEFNHACSYTTLLGSGYDQSNYAWSIASLSTPFTEAVTAPPKP